MNNFKIPISVLVVIHSPQLEILLLERTTPPGFWQSVTGSQEEGEELRQTAQREVQEETGIAIVREALVDWRLSNRFEIFLNWRRRFQPGITHNVEHVYSLCVARETPVVTTPEEHTGHLWLPWQEAALKVFSWTNRDAILMLGQAHGPESGRG
jgi:dATP pyrophosphohydrolase